MCNRTISHSVHSLHSLLFTSPSSPAPSPPPTPSLPLFSLSLYLTTLFSSSSHLPSSLSSSICFYPSSSFAVAAGLRCSCTDIAQGLPRLLFSPLDCGPPPISISPNPPVAACVFPSVLLDVSVLDNRSLDCYRGP